MQEDDIAMIMDLTEESMNNSIDHLQNELAKIRAGKASPAMLGGLRVEYYGTPTPLNQVANVSTSDARTLVIQPWEKKMLAAIERSIFEANLGFTPMNDGEVVRINVPALTEERRKDLVKRAHQLGEDSKVSIRNARRDANNEVKKAVKNGYPEDAGKRVEDQIQALTDKFSKKVEDMIKAKEADIMTI